MWGRGLLRCWLRRYRWGFDADVGFLGICGGLMRFWLRRYIAVELTGRPTIRVVSQL